MTHSGTPREQALADRAARIDRMRANLPAAMRDRPQWLFWRLEEVQGREGLQKVPYWINGQKRFGDLGGEKDRQLLATFDDALKRFAGAFHFTGVGFAFLDGDGLVGIDLDWKETGEPAEHHLAAIEACDSYTEVTPSGKGVHIIALGHCDSFKHDPVGVEVYCGGRYFTCTGDRLDDHPSEPVPLKPYALAYLRQLVDDSKRQSKEAKEAERAAGQAPADAPASRPAPGSAAGGDEFRRVNDMALQQLAAWVPQLLPGARAWRNGFRVSSKDLGRDLQEDLQLTPEGIMDFGEEHGMSPIDVVLKWGPGLAAPKDALQWLAPRVGVPLRERPRLQLVPDGRAPGEMPPPPPYVEEVPPEVDVPPSDGGGARRRTPRRGKGASTGDGGVLGRLLEHYALIRGTDTVWDGEQRTIMAVKNLRLLMGNANVSSWLAHPDRRLLLPEQIKFEPGKDLPDGEVNLFDGLPTEPVECEEREVKPMLDLLHHLCSLSAPTPEGVEEVKRQLLQWCALIVQQPGAKSRFALVMHGPQGAGKNLFCDALRKILGKYGKMVGQTELDDRFNGYMSGKLLLIGNEVVTRQELFHNKNKLKWVITEEEIPIRGMHQEVRWESNHAVIIFLSNELMPVALEWDDRRHLVIYTPAAADRDLYLRVADFLASDGHGKWMYYLKRHVDLDDFDEYTHPLMTRAKEALIDLGLKPAERFMEELLTGVLDLPLRVCSAEQMFRLYQRWCEQSGERDWRGQAMFTRTAERYVNERVRYGPDGQREPARLRYKQIALTEHTGNRKTVRCWVPAGTGPQSGETEGRWAWEAVCAFEDIVRGYGRVRSSEGEGGPDE